MWLRPSPDNVVQVRAATLCLINAQRARAGDQPLTENLMLRRAAELHSLDMAKRQYFEHDDPDGVGPDARIMRQGYPRSSSARTWRGPRRSRARPRTSSRCG